MSEYEDEWAADKQATDAQAAADAGAARSKDLDADPPFDFDEPAAAAPVQAAAQAQPPAPVKAMSFKEKFRAEMAAGAKTFEWNGKKYTTALKANANSPVSKPTLAAIATPTSIKPVIAVIAPPAAAIAPTVITPQRGHFYNRSTAAPDLPREPFEKKIGTVVFADKKV